MGKKGMRYFLVLLLLAGLQAQVCLHYAWAKAIKVKGEIVGIINEAEGLTLILESAGKSTIINWDRRKAEIYHQVLTTGNFVSLQVVKGQAGLQGVSAEKIRAEIILPSKKWDEDVLHAYKKAIGYFNPRLKKEERERIALSILYYSDKHRIDPRLVVAVIACESRFDVDARSIKGAIGLGQLMPATAEQLGVDPLNIEENILGTAAYLRHCLEKWKELESLSLAIAAYNAGPGAVEKYRGIPPYKETEKFVSRVLALYNHLCGQ